MSGLYQRYRPETTEDFLGNETVLKAVNNIFTKSKDKLPHSFLLTGPVGSGKTSLAYIMKDKLQCSDFDFHELNTADFGGIEMARNIRKNIMLHPMKGDCTVYFFDECHKLTNDAQNCLLKCFEAPPKHVYFILATTDPQMLIATIKSRCVSLTMKALSDENIKNLLIRICKAEGKKPAVEAMKQIIKESNGSARTALSILEAVMAVPPEEQIEMAKRYNEEEAQSVELCRALVKRRPWLEIAVILKRLEKGSQAEDIRRHVLKYCSVCALGGKEDVMDIIDCFRDNFYSSGFAGVILASYLSTLKK